MVDGTKKVASKHLIAMVAVRVLKFSVFLSVYKITLLPSFLFFSDLVNSYDPTVRPKNLAHSDSFERPHLDFYT